MSRCTTSAVGMLLLCAVAILNATTITVINTNDSGPGSLRQALADANDGDTIAFNLGGTATISLTSGELVINKNIAVMGPGANLLTIVRAQGAPIFRIFHVRPSHTVTIQGVTISNGSTFQGFAIGGAGIWNDHSNLTVNNCVLTGNAVDHQVSGGGISNDAGFSGSASLTVNNSIIAGNNLGASGTANFGGGIYNYGIDGNATLTMNNSTISGNQAFQGGGLFNDGGVTGSIAVVTINNSTFSGNYADQYAGGIMNEGNEGGQSTVIVTNSTFAGNSSCNCNFFAGAIFNDGNTQPGGAMLEMGNTIFKGGLTIPRNILNQGGVVISHGHNLTNDAGVLNTNGGIGSFNGPGDQINTDPLLGLLQDNGGPTFTHELLPGSPAINAGDSNFAPPPYYDQRGPGYDRVRNGRLDTGSFEAQEPLPTPTPTPTCAPTGAYRVLVVSADCSNPEITLITSLLAEPGIIAADFFDGTVGTPTLAQLQQYDIVLAFSNCGWLDPTTLGNNLHAYILGGGVVVATNFDWYATGSESIGGAWITLDSPFNDNATVNFSTGTLQTCTFAPLCNGVTTLSSFFREIPTLASGATQAGTWNDGSIMMAYKGRTVGNSGYFGDDSDNYSGQLPRIVANAGRYYSPPQCGTPTPTPTASPTPTPTFTPTSTPTPTPTPTPCTGRCSPTPRPTPSRITPTPTATGTPSPTPTPIVTPRPTPLRITPTPTATGTRSPTPTPILTPRPRSTPRPRP